jgi:hypothetical protein
VNCFAAAKFDNFRLADNPGVGPSMTTRAFVGTNPENTANFCFAGQSGGISAIVNGRLPKRETSVTASLRVSLEA